jgi:hypothetical protein
MAPRFIEIVDTKVELAIWLFWRNAAHTEHLQNAHSAGRGNKI